MAVTGRSRLGQTRLVTWMVPFQTGPTAPTWQRALVLIVGAILTSGRPTVAAALRITGFEQDPRGHFTNGSPISQSAWSSPPLLAAMAPIRRGFGNASAYRVLAESASDHRNAA